MSWPRRLNVILGHREVMKYGILMSCVIDSYDKLRENAGGEIMEVDITQAAQLLGKSTRQIMRYLEKGKLQAHKDAIGRWRIELASLERIGTLNNAALDVISTSQGVTLVSLLARIERLETELETLKRQAVLRSYIPTATASTPPGQGMPSRARESYTPSERKPAQAAIGSLITGTPARPDLPEGTIRMKELAEMHGVPRGTLASQIDKDHTLVTGIQTASRDGRQERWVTPEQQRRIVEYWRSMGTRHSQCGRSDCACME